MLISNNDYSLALSGRMRPASTELRLASAQCWLAASSFIRCISASFDFRLASERTWVLSLTEPVAFPGAFEDEDRRVVDCQKTRQLVPGCVFLVK